MNKRMTVRGVEDQGDRVLLYGDNPRYYLIAAAGTHVEIGTEVEYEPYGVNFGWLVNPPKDVVTGDGPAGAHRKRGWMGARSESDLGD